MAVTLIQAIKVFYSYAHEDESLQKELEKHLSNLRQQGLIAEWHDRQIVAGTDWMHAISSHLDAASLILLLISADFMASDYCYGIEMKRAMERHTAGDAVVIPILLRPVAYEGTLFENLQVLPMNAAPITTWNNQDAAFLDVAQGIRKAIEIVNGREPEASNSSFTPNISNKTPVENQGSIIIYGSVTAGVVAVGAGATIYASNSIQDVSPTLDCAVLKSSLLELFTALDSANLSKQVQIEAQTAAGLAIKQVEVTPPRVDILEQHLKRVGQILQHANVIVEQRSQLAAAMIKLAGVLGPVVGGARIVAGWFGIRLP